MSWLDDLFRGAQGLLQLMQGGATRPVRPQVNFVNAHTIVDNSGANRTDVTFVHPNEAGGGLHAVATPSVAGFMSASDAGKVAALEVSMVASGSDDFVVIQAALSAGGRVLLAPGTYHLSAPLVFESGNRLVCRDGVATLVPTWSGVGADDKANAVLKVAGSVVAYTRVLSGAVAADATSIGVTVAIAADKAGHYLRIRGVHGFGSVSNAITSELVRIATTYVGGLTTIPLQSPTWESHATGLTITEVTPIDDVEIENIFIDSTGNNTIAAGLYIEDALRVTYKNVSGRNLSRAVVNRYGSDYQIGQNTTDRGACNAIVIDETCHAVSSYGHWRRGEGARSHGSGIPRSAICVRAMSSDCFYGGGEIVGANSGISHAGGHNISFSDLTFSDLDPTDRLARDTYIEGGYCGIVYDIVSGYITTVREWAKENSTSTTLSNIVARQIKQGGVYPSNVSAAFLIQDCLDFLANGITLDNPSLSSTYGFTAFAVSDSSGIVQNFHVTGCDWFLYTKDTDPGVNFICGDFTLRQDAANPAMHFGHVIDSAIKGSMIFDDVEMWNVGSNWAEFPASWEIDHQLVFKTMKLSGHLFSDVRPYAAGAGVSTYVFCTVNASAALATAPAAGLAVAVSATSNGVAMVAMGEYATVYFPTTSPAVGDMVVPNGSGFGVVDTVRRHGIGTYVCESREALDGLDLILCRREEVGAPNGITFAKAAGAVAIGQEQAAGSTAGSAWTIRAQRGNGAAGGALTIGGGAPGTAATHAPGDTNIELDTAVTAGQSGKLNLKAGGAGTLAAYYYDAAYGALFEAYTANAWELLNGYRIWIDGTLAISACVDAKGFAVGGPTQTGQNRSLLVDDKFATAAPATGVFVGSVAGQVKTWSPNGIKQEVTCKDFAAGATSKTIYDRLRRITSTTAANQDVTILDTTDVPGGSPNWTARICVEWGGYENTNNKSAGGTRRATAVCKSGTITVMTTGANQIIGTDDDDSAAITGGASTLIVTDGAKVYFRFHTDTTTDSRLWCRTEATLVEH